MKAAMLLRSGLLVAFLAGASWPGWAAPSGCDRTAVSRSTSPDGARSAVVVESVCGADGSEPDVTAEVKVGTTTILGVDTGGHAEDLPRVAWSGPVTLDVTVPNLSFLRVVTLRVGDVGVRVHFDPDDPVGRAAWLAAHHLPADGPPLSRAGRSP